MFGRFIHISDNTHLLKLVDLSDEKVSVPTSNFSVCNVDHVLWECYREKAQIYRAT